MTNYDLFIMTSFRFKLLKFKVFSNIADRQQMEVIYVYKSISILQKHIKNIFNLLPPPPPRSQNQSLLIYHYAIDIYELDSILSDECPKLRRYQYLNSPNMHYFWLYYPDVTVHAHSSIKYLRNTYKLKNYQNYFFNFYTPAWGRD